ncbi:MAG: hypothetical protein OEW31_05070, partial [Thermoleophilia bacterium]|nr:hypothetical protein [Thermoleophilia bacterium]
MATPRLNALGRHLAVAGFMGAGKSTVGTELARRLGRAFVDLDAEIVRRSGREVVDLFAELGESGFRALEESTARDVLDAAEPVVVALGGGAVLPASPRALLARHAFTILLEVDPDVAWARARESGRPLARDEAAFRALHAARRPVYEAVADARARDVDEALLHAAGIHVGVGSTEELADLVPGEGAVEIVIDRHVAGIHGVSVQLALGSRDVAVHEVP